MVKKIHQRVADQLPVWHTSFSTWFHQQAVESIRRGWFEEIMDREGKDLYMLRMWLVQPRRDETGRWDSAESVLLHWFLRPDNDAAMHDHPWDFTTTVLSGAYQEALPAPHWQAAIGGPVFGMNLGFASSGQTLHHKAEDLHAIERLDGDVWTLVRTGPRVRSWGFHPPGKDWVGWREYLGLGGAEKPESEKVQESREKAMQEALEKALQEVCAPQPFGLVFRDPVNGAIVEHRQ